MQFVSPERVALSVIFEANWRMYFWETISCCFLRVAIRFSKEVRVVVRIMFLDGGKERRGEVVNKGMKSSSSRVCRV